MIEDQLRGGGRADTQLVFSLADAESLEGALHREGGDALVAFTHVCISKHHKEVSLGSVRDPELAAVKDPLVALLRGLGLETERVGSRSRFRERIGADDLRGETRQYRYLMSSEAHLSSSALTSVFWTSRRSPSRRPRPTALPRRAPS